MGSWILRNSWGEDGYMQIRYTNPGSNFFGHYFTIKSWGGESIRRVNTTGGAHTFLEADAIRDDFDSLETLSGCVSFRQNLGLGGYRL